MYKQAFTIAHQIKSLFTTFSDALKAAWVITRLFLGRTVTFTFAKETGELREATGIATGSLDTIEKGFVRFLEVIENGTQWRSFKIARLIF